jgi:hypothetical protein
MIPSETNWAYNDVVADFGTPMQKKLGNISCVICGKNKMNYRIPI